MNPETTKKSDYYRGWDISHSASRPVTGTWVANRYGVTICAGTLQALVRMIFVREQEDNWTKKGSE